jgi:hypothetical protein
MSNTFRKLLSEEVQQEMHDSVEEKASVTEGFILKLLSGGKLSSLWAASYLPFMLFLFCLGVIYIANRHHMENMVRDIDRVSNEVKVLSWEYKTLQADLMLKSTQSEIASKVESFGLKVLVEPPTKLKVAKGNNK